MNTEFPKSENQFIKSEIFQDSVVPLVFKGWEKKHNEDRKGSTWKQNLKFVLRYSYPEFAKDEAGETIMKDGKPFLNSNYDPKYPQGYTIVYYFEEGRFESGSLPLWKAFCMVRPKPGDTLLIGKTGKDKETKWGVKQSTVFSATAGELPDIQLLDNHHTEDETPF